MPLEEWVLHIRGSVVWGLCAWSPGSFGRRLCVIDTLQCVSEVMSCLGVVPSRRVRYGRREGLAEEQ